MRGGSAACDLLRLRTAQERGINQCQNFQINSDADMTPALNWLHQNLGGLSKSSPSPGGSNERSECRSVCCSDVGRGEGELNSDQGGASVPASRPPPPPIRDATPYE